MAKKVNRKTIVFIVAIVAVISIVSGTFAWFVTNSSLSQKLNISGIQASATVYFTNSENEKISADKYKDENGLYNLSIDKNAENYIGNLRVTVNRSGSKACMRVKMVYEWSLDDGSISQYKTAVPYKFNNAWYDNRNTDYCVYYKGTNDSGKAEFDKIELINGFNGSAFDTNGFVEGTSVKALIEVDAVQLNRYPQLWGIDKLPWG